MPNFLTIKDASDKTAKSVSTIRRLVRDIVTDDAHPDRAHIHPSPAEVKKLQTQEVQFAWKLSDELLMRNFGPLDAAQHAAKSAGNEEMFSMLQQELQNKERQLIAKDAQIEKLGAIVGSLNERLREGNVLMATLQKQLQLPQQTKAPMETEVKMEKVVSDVKVQKAEEGKKKAMAKIVPAPKKQPVASVSPSKKRNWLAVLFG